MQAPELDGLNEAQRAVVLAGGGALLVLAGAGTGKTRTLTRRAARLLRLGVAPEAICLLTFTHLAAEHIQQQLNALGLPGAARVRAGTFHAEALRALRAHGRWLGWADDFSVLAPPEAMQALALAAAQTPGAPPQPRALEALAAAWERGAARLCPLSEALDARWPGDEALAAAILSRYAWEKARLRAMDFTDLLLGWRRLLWEAPDGGALARASEHVLVDEYQDVNPLQAELVWLLARHHGNLTAVGDDSQAIYGFRGAEVSEILDFSQRWPRAKVFRLEENYRSTGAILRLANDSIARNARRHEKSLRAASGEEGGLPVAVGCRSAQEEAGFVAQRVEELRDGGLPLSEVAILYRSHRQSGALQEALSARGLAFEVSSGLPFFEQAHLKDMLSLLRALHNPLDEVSCARALRRLDGVGEVMASRVAQEASSRGSLREALLRAGALGAKGRAREELERLSALVPDQGAPGGLLEGLAEGFYGARCVAGREGAEGRREELRGLGRWAARFGAVGELLAEVSLLTGRAELVRVGGAGEGGAVTLTTAHRAKGLEWRAVFVVGLAEGWFPSARALEEGLEEEERRLFHVAVTRARALLTLSWPRSGRGAEGWMSGLPPSRFLEELGLGAPGQGRRFEVWRVEAPLG
jgi:DNA helicase-2/ATP-dependent DNA helicase PcrA